MSLPDVQAICEIGFQSRRPCLAGFPFPSHALAMCDIGAHSPHASQLFYSSIRPPNCINPNV